MNEEPESENILSVDFKSPPKEECPIRKSPKGSCLHDRILVDEEAHTVQCRKCQKLIDPFTALLGMARAFELRDYRLDEWNRLKAEEAKRSEARKARWAKR